MPVELQEVVILPTNHSLQSPLYHKALSHVGLMTELSRLPGHFLHIPAASCTSVSLQREGEEVLTVIVIERLGSIIDSYHGAQGGLNESRASKRVPSGVRETMFLTCIRSANLECANFE